jgi:hypothetical protein
VNVFRETIRIFAATAVLAALFISAPGGTAWADDNDLFAVGPEQVKSDLEGYFQKAATSIANNDFRAYRQEQSLINFKIEKYKKLISGDDKKAYKSRLAGLDGSVKQKTDSLIKVNLTIVKKNGRNAGYEFRQYLSVQAGLSETELAQVDEAIMASGFEGEDNVKNLVPPKPVAAPEPPPPQPTPAAPTPAPAEEPAPQQVKTPPPPPEPLAPARVQPTPQALPEKAQPVPKVFPEKVEPTQPQRVTEHTAEVSNISPSRAAFPESPEKTSPPARAMPPEKAWAPEKVTDEETERNRATAVSTAAKIRMLLDENKTDEAMTVFQIYQMNMQRFLDPSAYGSVKSAVESSYAQEQNGRTRAAQKALNIEQLLDQERVLDAFSELKKTRDELQRYLSRLDVQALEKRVGQAYVDFLRKQGTANAAMNEIRGLIADRKPEDAYLLFEKKQPDLERYCAKDAYGDLRKEVSAAYDVAKDKKKLSESCQRDILSLIKAGKGPAASARFAQNRPLLVQNLDGRKFADLESDVDRAGKAYADRQARARSIGGRIDSLIDKSRVEEAYGLFEETKDKMRRDIGDDRRFFEIKDRVEKTYDELRERQRLAARTSQKIEDLINRHEGRKANVLFRQETAQLREHLGPKSFAKLESAVERALADYESKSSAARSTIIAIEVMLDQKNVEQANAAYKKAEDDLDFYGEGNASAEALGKRVKSAMAALQERKQWASSVVRQVRGFVEKKKGNLAFAQFQEARQELAGYVDAKTMTSLDTSVSRANRQYAAAKSRAEQSAATIRGMIAQKQVEDAYAAFDTLESDLRFYIDPAQYTAIKTLVEKFNSALQDNKHEALRICGTINRFIEKDRGDTAFALFNQKDAFLVTYLAGPMYKAVGARAARAKNDFEKNCKLAQTLADRLQDMAQRENRVIAAHENFYDKRDYLEQYLVNWKFSRLETAVRVPYEAFMQKRRQERAVVSTLKRMIRQNQGVEARAEFDRCSKDLGRFLPEDEYKEISSKVSQAFESSVRGRKEAKTAIDKIHHLLGEDKISEAYRLFQDCRPTLSLYISDADFTRLSTEVTDAYDEQEKKVKQVKDYAKKLKQLVAKNKLWDAYKGFRMNHRALGEYLDAQSYADLENTVVGAYEKAHAKARNR